MIILVYRSSQEFGVKSGNVLVTHRKGKPPVAILMDFGSARPARRQIRSHSEALQLQEWASEHCSAPYRAPELWDCPNHADIDERTDIWSLGCTLFAIIHACRGQTKTYNSSSYDDGLLPARVQRGGNEIIIVFCCCLCYL